MNPDMSGLFDMLGAWQIGGVSIIVWIVGFLLISIVAIFVKGNR